MLTTRTHYLREPAVSIEEDGSVVFAADDALVREHLSGRHKGTVEHTRIRLKFKDRSSALAWLDSAQAAMEMQP